VKLRLSIIITSFITTLALLFVLWYGYMTWFEEKPLTEKLAAINGVQAVAVELSRDQVSIELELDEEAQLKAVHEAVLEAVQPLAKRRKVDIHFQDTPSREMEEMWHQLKFHVAEVLSHHQYRQLLDIAETMKEQLQLEKAIADMNAEFVYFQFQKGEHRLYQIFLRKQGEEGARG